jgi:predicted ATP-grasp superfamily ATP-dependent carboligase
MTVLAVAALCARMLAEAARDDGFDTVALDLFGDADTRRASSQWFSIGEPGGRIDAARLLSTLDALSKRAGVSGWIAGSGFEGRPELLERGAALLPLIGTQADAVRRMRDPRSFFGFLDAQGIAHPQVRLTAPPDAGLPEAGRWLVKDPGGCGGWHIRRARPDEPLRAPCYLQREVPGTPMSATFIANGGDACVLGFNQLIVRPFGTRPFVFCGAVGPLPLPTGVAHRISAAVRSIAAEFSLRGLGSLDFMLDGDDFGVLEVNPRPPASIALYGSCGIVAAHVRACLQGELASMPARTDTVRGAEIVFAPRPLRLGEAAARRLAERAGCHDLPAGAAHFGAADPVCSVSASGADAGQVRALLDQGREVVHRILEACP